MSTFCLLPETTYQKKLQSIRICGNAVFSANFEHSKFHWSIAVQTSFITVKTSTNFSPCPRICPHSSLTETPAAPNPDNMDTFLLNISLISRWCHIIGIVDKVVSSLSMKAELFMDGNINNMYLEVPASLWLCRSCVYFNCTHCYLYFSFKVVLDLPILFANIYWIGFILATEITQVKDLIPWVHCTSGNVFSPFPCCT